MSFVIIFMLTVTVTPIVLLYLKKPVLSFLQSILVVGAWIYVFEMVFHQAPAVFSLLWVLFHLALVFSIISWILLIIDLAEHHEVRRERENY